MWVRSELKAKAKVFLGKFYWKSFLVTLIVGLGVSGLTGSFNSGYDKTTFNESIYESEVQLDTTNETFAIDMPLSEPEDVRLLQDFMQGYLPMGINKLLKLAGVFAVVGVLFSIAIGVFVLAPLGVGGKKFFLEGATRDEVNFGHLGFAYKQEHYLNVVWVLFYTAVLNILFTLMLIIPGIIKAYAYSMVPYLLAEDPTLNAPKAIEISEAMTEGHKWDIFVLDLSFVLWHALRFVSFGLSEHFLAPYIEATKTQLYLVLKPINSNDALNGAKPYDSLSFDADF